MPEFQIFHASKTFSMSWSDCLQWLLSDFIHSADTHDEPIPEPGPKASAVNKTKSGLMDIVLEERNSGLDHAQVSVGITALLFLLQQITRDLEALEITSLFSHSSGGQTSKMSSAGPNSDANRTGLFWGAPWPLSSSGDSLWLLHPLPKPVV